MEAEDLSRVLGCKRIDAERVDHGIHDFRAARMNGPVCDVLDAQEVLGKPRFHPLRELAADQFGDLRGKGHQKSIVSDVPAHCIASVREKIGAVSHQFDGTIATGDPKRQVAGAI